MRRSSSVFSWCSWAITGFMPVLWGWSVISTPGTWFMEVRVQLLSPERPWASPVGKPTSTGSGAAQHLRPRPRRCGGCRDLAAGAGVGGADAGFGEFQLDGVRGIAGPRRGPRRRSGPVRSRWPAGRSGPGRRTSCRRCRSPCPGGQALRAVRRDGAAGVEFGVDQRAELGGGFHGGVQVQPEFAQDVQVGAEAGAGDDDVGVQGASVHGFDGHAASRGISAQRCRSRCAVRWCRPRRGGGAGSRAGRGRAARRRRRRRRPSRRSRRGRPTGSGCPGSSLARSARLIRVLAAECPAPTTRTRRPAKAARSRPVTSGSGRGDPVRGGVFADGGQAGGAERVAGGPGAGGVNDGGHGVVAGFAVRRARPGRRRVWCRGSGCGSCPCRRGSRR